MATFEEIQEEIGSMLCLDDAELTDEDREKLDQYLDELGEQEAAKVDSFAQFVRLQTEMAKSCRAESERLRKKARNADAMIGWLKEKYLGIMAERGLKKISGNAYTISVGNSTAVSAPTDEKWLQWLKGEHPEMVREKYSIEPDKKAIGDFLKGGGQIMDCALVTSKSLRIR